MRPVTGNGLRCRRRIHARFGAMLSAACMVIATGLPAAAQNFSGAFEGMRDRNLPVQIEADRLEVLDQDGVALFDGNVSVVQGTTVLKTKRLKVYYARGGNADAAAGNVRKIEASGKVAVRSGDQAATADSAVVDMAAQVAVMNGNVNVSQGANIVTGCKLTINMATNAARLEPCQNADSKGGRVKMMFTPGSTRP